MHSDTISFFGNFLHGFSFLHFTIRYMNCQKIRFTIIFTFSTITNSFHILSKLGSFEKKTKVTRTANYISLNIEMRN